MDERFAWAFRLAVYELENAEGVVTHPYGEKPEGLLIYDGHGHMSVQIMRPGTPRFAVDDRWMGTQQEVQAAFEGYVAYYGSYTIDEEKSEVTHHVEGSVFPNYVGKKLVRRYEFTGDTLVLSTPPMAFGGKSGIGRLTWVRV